MREYFLGIFSFLLLTWACLSTPAAGAEEIGSEAHHRHELPSLVITASPLARTAEDSALPVTSLNAGELQAGSSNSLGQALSAQPGVSSTYFGPGASRPVIRGLSGDRVRMLQNGTSTLDASNVSPDHAVASEVTLADRIEVLRGPATLTYGTNALGGVVNVVDGRIPTDLPLKPITGTVHTKGGSVDNSSATAAKMSAPVGPVAVYADGFYRDAGNVDIPGFAKARHLRSDSEDEPRGTLPNSYSRASGFGLGSSYILSDGYIGASVSELKSDYGLPNEDGVSIDLEQKRLDVRGAAFDMLSFIPRAELKIGASDYEHSELEGDEVGTVFENDGFDSRLELTHSAIGSVAGLVGTEIQRSDLSATGEESFLPPTETVVASIFVYEELPLLDSVKLQGGARLDVTEHSPESAGESFGELTGSDFTTASYSAGAVWDVTSGYIATFSLNFTERAPTAQELYSDGPHLAISAFEIGNPGADPERSVGADVSLKKLRGGFTGSVSGFLTFFKDYISLNAIGEERESLDVYNYESVDATFIGFESQLVWHALGEESDVHHLDFYVQPDYVWAYDEVNENPLPRITPLRILTGVDYAFEKTHVKLELQQVCKQWLTAENETETPDYSLLGFQVTRQLAGVPANTEVFLRGSNLLNEKARVHTSFVKDLVPLPGAGVAAGLTIRY